MKTLCSKLNFSNSKSHRSIKIGKWSSVNYFETLCLYFANNDLNPNDYTNKDFYKAAIIMSKYGQDDKSTDFYYFRIN